MLQPDVIRPEDRDALVAAFERLFKGEFDTEIYPDEWHWREGISKPDAFREIVNAWKSDDAVAAVALNAAIRTMRDHEAVRFAMLFCEPHNQAFYEARGWHPFKGEVYAEQPNGKIRFEAMAPYIFDFTRKPRDGIIDLCGLPW